VHLSVDAGVSNFDLEGTVVSPGSVPGVDSEPVVLAALGTPANHFDSVTTEGVSSSVLVDTALVGEEIFVDGEGCSHGSVFGDIGLDLVNLARGAESIARLSHVLILGVVDSGDGRARVATLRLDLGNGITLGESGLRLVVIALTHGVIVAKLVIAEISSGDNTLLGEPFPGSSNLTSIASHGLALDEVAAAGGIGDRKLVGESTVRLNAETIVVSLSGSMGPARTAVRLVADVVDDGRALGPVSSGIKCRRNRDGSVRGEVSRFNTVDSPFGVDDSSHDSLSFLERGVGELGVDTSSPGRGLVVVDDVDVGVEVKGSLGLEHLHDIDGLSLAHVESLASSFSILEVDIGGHGILDSHLLESGELFEGGL